MGGRWLIDHVIVNSIKDYIGIVYKQSIIWAGVYKDINFVIDYTESMFETIFGLLDSVTVIALFNRSDNSSCCVI